MRLIRLAQQPAGVSADVRAALASIGRGATVVGGVALVGVQPPDDGPSVDAVLILPKGLLVVVGSTLPEPAIRLEAPLRGQWLVDGWPLAHTGTTINPAAGALEVSGRLAARLRELHPAGEAVEIGTIVAVGPYVETVEQPADELSGTVRVLHPTATSMLAAAVSLARASEPLTTTQVRTFVSALAPETRQPSDEALLAEGFATPGPLTPEQEPTERYLAAAESTVPADPPQPVGTSGTRQLPGGGVVAERGPLSAPTPPPAPQASAGYPHPPTHSDFTPPGRSRPPGGVRWLPIGAVALLGCLLVGAIVMALAGGGEVADAVPPQSTAHNVTAPPATTAGGIAFTPRASSATSDCAKAAFGDIRAELADTGCLRLRRASFTASVHGRSTATTVAVLGFADPERAEAFKKLADTPGTGGIHDLATETGAWPDKRPRFVAAAYAGAIDGATVRLVRTDWLTGESDPADPALTRTATAALRLPLPG